MLSFFLHSLLVSSFTSLHEAKSAGKNNQNLKCGIAKGRIRSHNCSVAAQHIVNGVEAGIKTWPWQLVLGNNSLCGAVLIHPKYALTAAHCTINESSLDTYTIYGGFIDFHEIENPGNKKKHWSSGIKRIINNPCYNPNNSKQHDISILEFVDEAPTSDCLFPVCLPELGERAREGQDCYATGWGDMAGGESPYKLQEVCVPILNKEKCIRNYKTISATITENMICAGYFEGGKDTCQGDSGGPLVCKQDGIWKLFGLVSFGEGCAEPGFPGIYTDVTKYLKWIKKYVQ